MRNAFHSSTRRSFAARLSRTFAGLGFAEMAAATPTSAAQNSGGVQKLDAMETRRQRFHHSADYLQRLI